MNFVQSWRKSVLRKTNYFHRCSFYQVCNNAEKNSCFAIYIRIKHFNLRHKCFIYIDLAEKAQGTKTLKSC